MPRILSPIRKTTVYDLLLGERAISYAYTYMYTHSYTVTDNVFTPSTSKQPHSVS